MLYVPEEKSIVMLTFFCTCIAPASPLIPLIPQLPSDFLCVLWETCRWFGFSYLHAASMWCLFHFLVTAWLELKCKHKNFFLELHSCHRVKGIYRCGGSASLLLFILASVTHAAASTHICTFIHRNLGIGHIEWCLVSVFNHLRPIDGPGKIWGDITDQPQGLLFSMELHSSPIT